MINGEELFNFSANLIRANAWLNRVYSDHKLHLIEEQNLKASQSLPDEEVLCTQLDPHKNGPNCGLVLLSKN